MPVLAGPASHDLRQPPIDAPGCVDPANPLGLSMSYEIAIINPRKRKSTKRPSKAQLAARRRFVAKYGKGRKTRRRRKVSHQTTAGVSAMAKRRKRRSSSRTAKGHFKKSTHTKRRRRRSSGGKRHAATGYTVGSRKIRRRKLNPRGARRRRYRRNPIGLPSMAGITGQLMNAGIGAAGAMALNFGLSFIPLPDSLNTGYVKQGVRLASALAANMLAKKFLGNKPWINVATAGALTVIMYDIGKTALTAAMPETAARLGDYEDVSLNGDLDGDEDGFVDPASVLSEGAGAYLEGPGADDGDADDMGAYMEGDLDGVGIYG